MLRGRKTEKWTEKNVCTVETRDVSQGNRDRPSVVSAGASKNSGKVYKRTVGEVSVFA